MSEPVELAIGSVFGGDFRVVRKLSEGGMGAVWVAEQLSTGKERALKLMHAQMIADARLRERFAQEARIGARIESDHVVEVVAAGVEPSTGSPWLAMELLKGETLADRIARGPLDLPTAREVFAQLAHALVAAHDARIVHRDLKPDNLFLAHPRRTGVPFMLKVLDFGIAKLVLESHSKHTQSIGTPMWMAPEQTEIGKPILPACDVWAVGLIAYAVLTGRSYWHSANIPDTGPLQLMREVLIEPLDAASQRANAYGVAHLLPPGFDAWFARCVVRSIEQRFPHAREALGSLDSVLGGAPVAPMHAMQTRLPTVDVPPPQRTMEMSSPPTASMGTQPAPQVLSIAHAASVDVRPAPSPRRSALPWIVLGGGALIVAIAVVASISGGQNKTQSTSTTAEEPSPSAKPTTAITTVETSTSSTTSTVSSGESEQSETIEKSVKTVQSTKTEKTIKTETTTTSVPLTQHANPPTQPVPATPTLGVCPSYQGNYVDASKSSDWDCVRSILLPKLNAGSISSGEAKYLKAACMQLGDGGCAKRAAEKI